MSSEFRVPSSEFQCPDTDAIATIGGALNWVVSDGLRHLQACDECRSRIGTLRSTRVALSAMEVMDDAALDRISAALRDEAHAERASSRKTRRWAGAVEALLAGVTAPIALISGGVAIGSIGAGALTVALGAILVAYGRRLWAYA